MNSNLVPFILLICVGICLILYVLPADFGSSIWNTSKDTLYTKKNILYSK